MPTGVYGSQGYTLSLGELCFVGVVVALLGLAAAAALRSSHALRVANRVRRLFVQLRVARMAARIGVEPTGSTGTLAPAGSAVPRRDDGSWVTVRFAEGAALVLDPPPSDAALRRRYRCYEEFLALVARLSPKLGGLAQLHLRDEHPAAPPSAAPQLVFNRRRGAPAQFRVVPDMHFVKHRGHSKLRQRLAERAVAWEERRAVALWRGSSTGGSLGEGDDPTRNHRVELCLLSLRFPELLDARLGRVVDCHPSTREKLRSLGIVDRFIAPPEQIRARYLISIDGWAAEWDGLVWKLASGSVVLVVESRWELWYSRRIEPWKHYVPVRADLGDLVEKITWCRDHDPQCRAIAERAAAFAREELTFAEAVRFTQRQLAAPEPAADASGAAPSTTDPDPAAQDHAEPENEGPVDGDPNLGNPP